MTIDITRFILYAINVVGLLIFLYIGVIEIFIHNKLLFGRYFPKEEDYKEFVKRNSLNSDVLHKR
ncbi:hypothetical protein [Bacillus cereus group sp. BceL293]|uniref:hypothetical protein n=1 Tax=Bacillus cereus group sp. BceL293 TaxID=3444992 RepID=UPI003F1E89F6